MSDLQNRRLYNAGEAIVEEGQSGIQIYIIEKGTVEVWKRDADGKRYLAF